LIRRALAAASLRAAGLKYFFRPLGAVTDLRAAIDLRAIVDFPAAAGLLCVAPIPLCAAGLFAGVFLPAVADFLAEVVAGFFRAVSSELEDFAGFSSYLFPSIGVPIIRAQSNIARVRAGACVEFGKKTRFIESL
jgi:hypothetical protein